MGKILECVLLLSHISLLQGIHHLEDASPLVNHERGKLSNITTSLRLINPKSHHEFFKRDGNLPPVGFQTKGSRTHKMMQTPGLQAYATNDFFPPRNRRRHPGPTRNGFPDTWRKKPLPFPPNIAPGKKKASFGREPGYNYQQGGGLSAKLNSFRGFDNEASNRKYNGRNAKFNHQKHSPKICDACNSVPWVPLFKVPDSYRQQRTHLPTTVHSAQGHDLHVDFSSFPTDTHNILLPPVPIYDGTISSSFGLPIGNIPTGHGLLAPINHLTQYAANSLDFSNSLKLFPTQSLLETNPLPELSPLPIVPIHDPTQFYSPLPSLIPPATTKTISNVIFTISEDNHGKLNPDSVKLEAVSDKDLHSDMTGTPIPLQSSHNQEEEIYPPYPPHPPKDSEKLEIVKSIPLAEFTTTVKNQQLQGSTSSSNSPIPFSSDILQPPPKPEYHEQSSNNLNFLVPPPQEKVETDTTFNPNKTGVLPFLHPPNTDYLATKSSTVPKPLTSSLSWLFDDHTLQSTHSTTTKSTPHYLASESQDFASIVNKELQPITPLPLSQNITDFSSKGKKIQIIIPYTTKNKLNNFDHNAVESIKHEVYETAQPPTQQNESVSQHYNHQQKEAVEEDKYLKEMQHIIAKNIRELLRGEIETSHSDQNYPLQNNIDNWTALEYSNHKTVDAKPPGEIINQALAVTSIPGTSISHLLLPSKKIPREYLSTTALPAYDEPKSLVYNATNTTVDSRPFTARPYATTNLYHPKTHKENYTEVTKIRPNNWGKLKENLVLPELHTTESSWTGLFSTNEKIHVVTPVSSSIPLRANFSSYRRTTRQIHSTVKPIAINSTKLEKVTNVTSPFLKSSKVSNVTTVESVYTTEKMVTVSVAGNETEKVEAMRSNRSEKMNINDIFPFRNQELPWQETRNASQVNFRQRKRLIKQVKIQKNATKASNSS